MKMQLIPTKPTVSSFLNKQKLHDAPVFKSGWNMFQIFFGAGVTATPRNLEELVCGVGAGKPVTCTSYRLVKHLPKDSCSAPCESSVSPPTSTYLSASQAQTRAEICLWCYVNPNERIYMYTALYLPLSTAKQTFMLFACQILNWNNNWLFLFPNETPHPFTLAELKLIFRGMLLEVPA